VRGEDPTRRDEAGGSVPDYRRHLEAAEHLLRTGSGAAAVPELVRALEIGGEEARRAVNDLLAP
jgi:hypothetical protein